MGKRIDFSQCTHLHMQGVNATEEHSIFSDSEKILEGWSWDDYYKYFRDDFGKCIGKVNIDQNNDVIQVGWVFQKLMEYTDAHEKYLQETWVYFYKDATVRQIEYPV